MFGDDHCENAISYGTSSLRVTLRCPVFHCMSLLIILTSSAGIDHTADQEPPTHSEGGKGEPAGSLQDIQHVPCVQSRRFFWGASKAPYTWAKCWSVSIEPPDIQPKWSHKSEPKVRLLSRGHDRTKVC